MEGKSRNLEQTHLQLDHLAVGYQGKALIHGIEIGVRRGEIVTLVGPNGSGKSTILKTITRQLTPVSGGIFLAEGKTASASAMKSLGKFSPGELAEQMAVMLTGRLQTELMTCRDVTSMGRYPYTGRLGILSASDEQKVEEALAAVHAQHLSDRPFDAVSDGERQRILLARAICQEPEIIVLDEPTSYLDIRHKLELLGILHKMSREQGITVVMSLHEIDLAMKISDRIICVRGEEIFACGKPAEILDDETVRQLYDLDPELGRFDARTGSLELFFAENGSLPESKPTHETIDGEENAGAEESRDDGEKTVSITETAEYSKGALSIPRIMIAAPGSGSGKTLITCGLLRLLQRKKLQPAAFKCGPDYIDPMFHRQVLGIPSRNLDTFFSPADSKIPGNTVKETLVRAVRHSQADIAVIEGVMGFFDGTGSSGMEASSCDLARQTDTPVILVVNAKGMSRSIVPLLRGFSEYEEYGENEKGKSRIRGVILNRISAGIFPMMKKWIEEDTSLKVIGYLPQDDSLSWGSRHLGLLQPEEVADLQRQIDHLADVLEKTIDSDALLKLADAAPRLRTMAEADKRGRTEPKTSPCIAVARDEAFNFYYEDNLELLQECGARLVFFSPVHDRAVPEADGLLLGGGYPELHAGALAENDSMKEHIRKCAAAGMPILAECGGFMYLQQALELPGEGGAQEGQTESYTMCGVLPGSCRMTDKLVRFGYIELEKKDPEPGAAGCLQDGHRIRGHEFHYFDSTDNGEACTAHKPGRKRSWDCMVTEGNLMAGFPHLYYRSDPAFAEAFVEKCRRFSVKKQAHLPAESRADV
jgi:cobyrinic acid a,c-diamide synthase